MPKSQEKDGVWRTIGGRRIFIKGGQDLASAMVESGKFKNLRSTYRNQKAKDESAKNEKAKDVKSEENERLEIAKDIAKELYAMKDDNPRLEKQAKDLLEHPEGYVLEKGEKTYTNSEGKLERSTESLKKWRDELKKSSEGNKGVNLSEKQIEAGKKLSSKAEDGIRNDVKEFTSGRQDYSGSRQDFIRDLADNWGVDKDKAEEIVNDELEKHPRLFKTDRPQKDSKGLKVESARKTDFVEHDNSWKEDVKKNNERMEKDVTDIENKMNEYRNKSREEKDPLESYRLQQKADNLQNDYYERFRQNERDNAKVKRETPNDKYELVDAHAGYKRKFDDTWGKDGQGTSVVSARMYTNDEFMEHLEDANWHSERRQLLDAKLTNRQLEYIKDRTRVSAWGVENLDGREQVTALIKEAKEKYPSNTLVDTLRRKAYQKYLKEHPNSKMKFNQFKENNE